MGRETFSELAASAVIAVIVWLFNLDSIVFWGIIAVFIPVVSFIIYCKSENNSRAFAFALLVIPVAAWLVADGFICYDLGFERGKEDTTDVIPYIKEVERLKAELAEEKKYANQAIKDLAQEKKQLEDKNAEKDTVIAAQKKEINDLRESSVPAVVSEPNNTDSVKIVELTRKIDSLNEDVAKSSRTVAELNQDINRINGQLEDEKAARIKAEKIVAAQSKDIDGLQTKFHDSETARAKFEGELKRMASVHSEDIKQLNESRAAYDRTLRTLFFDPSDGIPEYYTEALKFLREIADKSTEARFLIGYILDPYNNSGVTLLKGGEGKNAQRAMIEYEIAAKNGHENAKYFLEILRNKLGIKPGKQKSRK